MKIHLSLCIKNMKYRYIQWKFVLNYRQGTHYAKLITGFSVTQSGNRARAYTHAHTRTHTHTQLFFIA